MYWVISLVGALLVGALLTYLLATVFGRGEALPAAKNSPWAEEHRAQLDEQDITADTVDNVVFTQTLRGYSQEEVDNYLQRITAKLREYERGEHGARTQSHVPAQHDTDRARDTTEEHPL